MVKDSTRRIVHGDDLLYRFFHDLFTEDSELAGHLPYRMLATMGIWLPLDVYHEWPILMPWVVRDATCRGSRKHKRPDEWGAPNTLGYLRDDNSLIKNLPRSLIVSSPGTSRLKGARMGSEFVASHVWRIVDHSDLASRSPLLNSFVANLVWLPSQVSKLSDREGGPVQAALQAMAWSIYRRAPVAPHLTELVEEAWAMIPEPPKALQLDTSTLNWFTSTSRFKAIRLARLSAVIDALERIQLGVPLEQKVVTTRYTEACLSWATSRAPLFLLSSVNSVETFPRS